MGLLLFDMIRSEQIFNLRIFFASQTKFLSQLPTWEMRTGLLNPFLSEIYNLRSQFPLNQIHASLKFTQRFI